MDLTDSDSDDPRKVSEGDVRSALKKSTVISAYKPQSQRAADLDKAAVIRRVEERKLDALRKAKLCIDAQRTLEKEKGVLEKLRNEHRGVKGQIRNVEQSSLLGAVKREEIAKLSVNLGAVKKRIELQERAVERETKMFYHADQEKDKADMELHRLREAYQGVLAEQREEAVVERAVASARVQRERIAAKRAIKNRKKAVESAMKTKAAMDETDAKKKTVAFDLNKTALKRAAGSQKAAKEMHKVGARLTREAHDHKTDAVLSLKHHTDKAVAELRGKNASRARRDAKIAEAEKAEAIKLLENGMNPYEVFRARRRDKDVDRQIKRHEEKVFNAKMKLAAEILDEDERNRHKEALVRQHKEFAEAYKKSLSRPVREAAVAKYISERTKGGVDIIDPTGRAFRVQPSQVTVIKDHAFGLGRAAKSRPDIVDKISAKKTSKNVTFNPRWIPKDKLPPEEKQGTAITLEDDEDDPVESEEEGGMGATGTAAGAGLGGLDTESSMEDSRGLTVRPPSLLEKKILAAALERQRAGIVQKQVVWGKEYKGCGFLPAPAEIRFTDFDVGRRMSLRLTLTNVSYTFNNFKVVGLDNSIRDFFEIVFTPPGRMSAGMACPITIHFNPKTNDDIHSELRMLAKTGAFVIPLHCTCKKALPVVQTPVVDIGDVVLGENKTAPLKLKNVGALPVGIGVRVVSVDPDPGYGGEEKDAEPFCPTIRFKRESTLASYGKLAIPFTFTPKEKGRIEMCVELHYDNPLCEPVRVLIKARALPVPIYVEKEVMDMKTCVYGKLYRGVLVLRNRGNIALKCLTSIPPGLRGGVLDFVPKMGFVQARDKATGVDGKFDIQMKFRPPKDLLSRPSLAEYVNLDTGELEIPITVTAPDQVLPVIFKLRTRLTPSDVTFDPPRLDFGTCYTSQAVSMKVKITNHSDLPQKFGFIKPPSEVSITPGDGFGTLLPHETVERTIVYSAISAVEHKFALKVMTTMNKTFLLPCMAAGATAPLKFSTSVLSMAACAVGEVEDMSVYVTNVSPVPQLFDIVVPRSELSQIRISPLVSTLQPDETVRVQVEFAPKPEAERALKCVDGTPVEDDTAGDVETKSTTEGEDGEDGDGAEGGGGGGGEGKGSEEDGEGKEGKTEADDAVFTPPEPVDPVQGTIVASTGCVPGERWSRHATWYIPCFMRPAPDEEDDEKLELPDSFSASEALVLEVNTVLIEHELTTDLARIPFGQVSVGRAEVKTVRVHNRGRKPAGLIPTGFNPAGCFSLVNAPRVIKPGEYQDVMVQFRPASHKKYVETLLLSSSNGGATREVVVAGEGVSPSLAIDPADGLMDMGHAVIGDSVTKTFSIKNTSVFPLQFNLINKAAPFTNYGAEAVFSCAPTEATVPPGESQTIAITFKPDFVRRNEFVSAFHVDVPNQTEEVIVVARGRAWSRQVYVMPSAGTDEVKEEHPFNLDSKIDLPISLKAKFEGSKKTAEDAPPTDEVAYTVQLAYPKPRDSEPVVKELLIGGVGRAKEKASSAGSFEFVLPTDEVSEAALKLFTIEPMKGNAPAGGATTVKVKYTPSEKRSADPCVITVGQWTEAHVKCIIRGGATTDGVSDEETVMLKLRGFMYV